jgi:flagellar L-ring protein FlgH
MRKFPTIILLLTTVLSMAGCASFGQTLKSFLGGDDKVTTKKVANTKTVGKVDKSKNYQRTNHETLQEKSKLGAESGSLWIERGQGSYLFTQNTNRLIGDLVNVEIDGQPKKQIETKVAVIQNLIDKIKAQNEERNLASQNQGKAAAGAPVKAKAAAPAATKDATQKFDVKTVPSRITQITKDGSYIVDGEQAFMIGKREYKLMVSGIVRQEDFDDQGISAETLLDPKFDIVTSRKNR